MEKVIADLTTPKSSKKAASEPVTYSGNAEPDLSDYVKRALRRNLTEKEAAKIQRAQEQGYNVAGWHFGNFNKSLPAEFEDIGERAAFHLDLSPYGNQAVARSALTDSSPKSRTRLIVARLNNPTPITDEGINNLRRTEKKNLLSSGSSGAIYPNTGEIGFTNVYDPDNVSLPEGSSLEQFIATQIPKSNAILNPSAAIFKPEDVRLFDAEFNPEKIGKVGYRLADGGSVKRGVLARYAETLPQRQAEAARKASVMSQPREQGWQPEYEKEPPLEAPMISPDDLIGTGIPTKLAMMLKGAAPMIGALGVIKNKGGNWLSGSVEGALGGLKKDVVRLDNPNMGRLTPRDQEMLEMTLGALHDFSPETRQRIESIVQPINQWIDKPLTRYVKNEMATPEDPIRALAERGVLHFFAPEGIPIDPAVMSVVGRRSEQGFPTQGLGKADLAKQWEALSDAQLRAEPASTYQNFGSSNLGEEWINKLDPNTPFYRPKDNTGNVNLGFNHLIDELSNAINPESGLPRHLQFPADRLDKVSVSQAVERVDAINKWRAALKAEADQAKANNAATVMHKEYPENNPKGLKWVELKANKKSTTSESSVDDMFDAEKYEKEQYQALKDALKYEGDTMGHCVGGYCDDVASGRSRIYSLRDAKGQPHVTVETGKAGGDLTPLEEFIVQIKGKGNLKPADEYQPFVQDFVKSGKWSDVGDLQNTGLRRGQDVFNELEKQELQEAGHGINEYLSPEEIADLQSKFGQRFAQGGSVTNKIETPEQLRAILSELNQKHLI